MRVLNQSRPYRDPKGGCYKFWCTGGIDTDNPWNPKDNKYHIVMIFCRDYLGKLLNNSAIKVLVICLYFVYLGGAIYGCTQIEEGLQMSKLTLDDSYLVDFFDTNDRLFKMFPYRYQVVINENLTYSDPDTKQAILELHETIENMSFVAPSIFSQSWIRGFYKLLDRKQELKENITDEKSFITILKSEYLARRKIDSEYLDVKFNEDETEIVASRFLVQAYKINNANEDVKAMLELRRIAKESKFNVVVFNIHFPIFDQFATMRYICIQTITLAAILMMIVSIIFIPNPLCSLWIAFSIISIEIGVLGYMALWGINLDSISVINLIICVGFSVDFSAHITYAYLTARASTPAGKVEECLFHMGLPILQGGLSTIIGIIALCLPPSYVFATFSKTIFLVIIFGMMHSLLLLPVLLSVLGPASFKKDELTISTLRPDDSSIVSNDMKAGMKIGNDGISKKFGLETSESSLNSIQQEVHSASESIDVESARNLHCNISDGGNQNEAFIYDDNDNIDVRL